MPTDYVSDYEELFGLQVETKVISAPDDKTVKPATTAEVK